MLKSPIINNYHPAPSDVLLIIAAVGAIGIAVAVMVIILLIRNRRSKAARSISLFKQ